MSAVIETEQLMLSVERRQRPMDARLHLLSVAVLLLNHPSDSGTCAEIPRCVSIAQGSVSSSFNSHMSTEARVPGVSEESIALNTWAPASMSSALSNC